MGLANECSRFLEVLRHRIFQDKNALQLVAHSDVAMCPSSQPVPVELQPVATNCGE